MKAPAQADEILTAVREVLDARTPGAAERHVFDARVASRLLALLQRELELGAAAQAEERRGLDLLLSTELPLDCPAEPVEVLREHLCTHIAEMKPSESPQVLAHLWQTALAQLAIDSPRYRWGAAPDGPVE